ncbi:MAG: adenylate/guanylate cyclase domain-containing protein [Kofleriaceae bacterium]|nr:adenylate/guanylate cyclase domain-containing protein [Kofleriaceae bacterium]
MTPGGPQPTPPRRRLRRRLVVIIVVIVVVPLLALGLVLTGRYQRAAEAEAVARLQLAADAVAAGLTRAVDGLASPLETVANLLASDQADLGRVTATVAASPQLGSVAVYDQDGALVDVIRRADDPAAAPSTLAPALRAQVARRGRWVGDVEGAPAAPHLPVVLPVRGRGATWYVRAALPCDGLSTLVHEVAEGVMLGGGAEELARSLFVVDRQRQVVAHSNSELVAVAARLTDEPALAQLDLSRRGPDAPAYGTSGTYQLAGQRWLGWTRTTHDLPFIIVAQTPRAVALYEFEQVRRGVAAAVAAVALVVIGLGLVLARRITAPLDLLARQAQALGARDFDKRFDIHTGDELEVVAGAMHQAARALADSEADLQREAAIRADLGRYLPAPLLERVVARDHTLALGGQRRTVTLLFADVAGFTSLAERNSPETVVALLGQLFTVLTEVVFRHGGTVDKLVGDSMLAVWNMAEDQPDHAARALAAARDMRRWIDAGNRLWRRDFGATIALAIGVHTGEVVVGNLGSESRMEYTCVGDAVNVASALERLARPQQIVTTEATAAAAARPANLRPLGSHPLPGRLEPFVLFELVV